MIHMSCCKNTFKQFMHEFSEKDTRQRIISHYIALICDNHGFLTPSVNQEPDDVSPYLHTNSCQAVFKTTVTGLLVYGLLVFIQFLSYLKQIQYLNKVMKLSVLHENEKEIGPVDDFFFFSVLFVLTVSSFILGTIFILLTYSSNFISIIGSIVIISILILSIPTNLFIDFGVSYFVYIKGSSSGKYLLKELLFDLISSFTVFIRFIIQNIRFLFIFLAIFELLE